MRQQRCFSRMGFVKAFLLFSALAASTSACVDDPADTPPVAAVQGGNEITVAKLGCEDQGFCTREYRPTSCSFNGQKFASSNPCEAMKLARLYACEKKLSFSSSAVTCKASDDAPVEQ